MSEMISAIVFGGAFNPPTRAHIEMAKYVLDQTGREKVIFVPSKTRYIREDQGKDFAFSDEERLDMLRAVAKSRPWMDVSDYEIRALRQPRTYETLCHLRDEGIQGAMLIGSDKLKELAGGWLYIPEICREFGIICMARGSDDCEKRIREDAYLSQLAPYITLIDSPDMYREISSTRVRRLLAEPERDETALHAMLPEELWGIQRL